jgi:hypothetical protein
MASVAALISTSVMLSGCETVAYKPIICEPGTALKDGRCAKVVKTKVAKPHKATTPRAPAQAPIVGWNPKKPGQKANY